VNLQFTQARKAMLTSILSRRVLTPVIVGVGLLAVSACGLIEERRTTGTISEPGGPAATESNRPGGLRGDLTRENQQGTEGVAVNRFAWQAALDTLSFMPIRTSDPYGGVIATDWYSPRESPNERLRLNVRVRGRTLSSESIRVTVFREVRADSGWETGPVSDRTGRDLENVILTRARALRIEAQSAN
jgi:hypothetical protein